MRKLFLFAVSALMILGSCSQDEMVDSSLMKVGGKDVIVASFEGQSNTRITESSGALSWEISDKFDVFGAGKATFTTTSQNAATGTFTGTAPENAKYAVYYPADDNMSITSDVLSVELAAEYNASESVKAPMWGLYNNGSISFKHLGAALKFTYAEIPDGYTTLVVQASKPINGIFTANLTAETPILATSAEKTDANNSKVIVTITSGENGKFYIPLPVDTYDLSVTAQGEGKEDIVLKSWTDLNIARKGLYSTTAQLVIDATTIAAVNNALQNAGEAPTTINLKDAITVNGETAPIQIPETAENVTLNFEAAPVTTEDTPLVINQNDEATSGDATSELNITMPDDAEGLHATINAPTTTVTLEGGTYESLVATTATNTLIIGEGVTIKKLVVMGGNVVLKGNVESIESDEATTTVTLGGNLTITNPIAIGNGVTLDLGGYTITEAEDYNDKTLNISGNATIKNGTIEVSNRYPIVVDNENGIDSVLFENVTITGDRKGDVNNGVILLVGYANVTLDSDVTITAKGYAHAVEAACYEVGDTDAAQIDIKDATISLESESSQGTAIGAGYGSTINVEGATIDGSKSLYAVSVFNTGGTINIIGDNNTIKGAFYKYTPNEGKTQIISISKGTFTDASAFDYLISGAEVTLGGNLTITNPIAIGNGVTLDLGGYTITEAEDYNDKTLNISGNATIKNGTIEVSNRYPIVVDNENGIDSVLFENVTITGDRKGDVNNGVILLVGYANVTLDSDVTITAKGYAHAVEAACYEVGDTDAAQIDIKDATISLESESSQGTAIGAGYGSTINVEGATIDGSKSLYAVSVFNTGGTINIIGDNNTIKGAFYKYTPNEGKTQIISISKGTFTDASAFDYLTSGAEVTLGADIEITDAITIPTGITATIKLNGFDVTAPNTDAFEVAGTLTINGTEESVVSAGTEHPNASVCAVWANGGNVTIEGGHYKAYSDAAGKRNDCIYAGYNADNNNTAGNITINGGKFEYVWPDSKNSGLDYNGDMYLLNCADKDFNQTLITVNGGQFKNNAPSYEPTTPASRPDSEVKLGTNKKVYNGETEVTDAHSGTTDIWYVVK